MTYAALPPLRHAPDLARRFAPLLTARTTIRGCGAPEGKAALLAGMAMTEKQGGSDVRAKHDPGRAGAHGRAGRPPAHRAQMVLLRAHERPVPVLAQAPDGLTCFLPPGPARRDPQRRPGCKRLKDKLGNRSNASAEVEFDAALAWQVARPAAGCPTIIEMVSATRLDCVLGSAAGMRLGCVTAVHYATHQARLRREPDLPAADGLRPR